MSLSSVYLFSIQQLRALILRCKFQSQPLETGVAYKKTEYRCNCQGNYTLFSKDKLCQNKQAEIGKK